MRKLRLAVSMRRMRVDFPGGGSEERDALAADWGRFLQAALPDVPWLPLPNVGDAAVGLAQEWGVTGLILTGGDNVGIWPQRDATERALLCWARRERLPVLGVCRGAQLIYLFAGGGALQPVAGHVNVRHRVCLSDGTLREVNSFHALGIPAEGFAPQCVPVALTKDGAWVEAYRHKEVPWLGLLWHPERERKAAAADLDLIRQLFLEQV